MTRKSVYRNVAWVTAAMVCGLAATAWAANAAVPDVVGLQVDQAKALMQQAGFETTVMTAPGHPIGQVYSQEPGGLAPRSKGTTVTLRVGGPSPKPGMGMPTAQPTQPTPRDDIGAPPAGSQHPAQPGVGTPARGTPGLPPAGSMTALVWRGRAIPEGRMPDTNGPEIPAVLGQTESQARRTLSGWRVTVEQTMAVPELVGKVVNQMPFAGTHLARSETVTIIVAVATAPSPNHVFVPQAHGKHWLDGLEALEAGGLQPMPRSVASSAADRGRILAQTPHTGSLAPRGSAVVVLVGRGPGAYSADIGDLGRGENPTTRPAPKQPGVPPRQPEPRQPTPKSPPDDTPPAGTTPIPTVPQPKQPEPVELPEPTPVEPPTPSQPDKPTTPPAQPDKPTSPPAPTLAAPSLDTPPSGESYPYKYGADFAWSAISGAEGYELELQEEQPSGAWTKVESFKTVAPKYRPAKIDRGRYRWRVRAYAGDTQGPWSEFRRLYMY